MLSITPLFCVAKEQALFFSLGVFLIELKLYTLHLVFNTCLSNYIEMDGVGWFLILSSVNYLNNY